MSKRNKSGKGAGAKFFAVLLALVFIGTAVACGFGWWQVLKLKQQIAALTPAEGEQQGDGETGDGKEPEEPGDVGGMIITPDEITMSLMELDVKPMSLSLEDYGEDYDISTLADTGFTVTATAYYENGDVAFDEDQYFIFSLNWASSKSANVSDYVTISSTDRTASLTLKQGFDTQMILTCAYAFNDSIQGTATIDYAKRFGNLISVDLNGEKSTVRNGDSVNTTYKYQGNLQGSANWCSNTLKVFDEAVMGIGTVTNSITHCSATLEYSEAFKTALTNRLPSFAPSTIYKTYTVSATNGKIIITQADTVTKLLNGSPTWIYSDSYFGTYKQVLSSTTNAIKVTLNLSFKYGGNVTYVYYMNVGFDVAVSSLNVDNTSFIL